MTVKSYLIEPLSPLVFRSGKPFGSQASSADVIFPLPSTVAGLVRATCINQDKVGMDEHQIKAGGDALENTDYKKVLSISAQGPYLARFGESKDEIEVLLPKPADALYFEDKESGQIELVRLSPKAFDEDCSADLPDGLLPVQMIESKKGKPKSGVTYWSLEHVKKWQAGEKLTFTELQEQGIANLPTEIRTHVAIESATQAGESGKLFQTANMDLGYQKQSDNKHLLQTRWNNKRLGFVIQTEQTLNDDTVTFGGERRLSKLSLVQKLSQNFYDDKKALLTKINQAKGFRLTFLTPCIFAQGYLPQWLDKQTKKGKLPNTDIEVTLKACAIDRWQAVSGWDSILWKPKAMRKAVCSGSVYWFELDGELSEENLDSLIGHIWSDDKQDKCDGFGSAMIAPWQKDI